MTRPAAPPPPDLSERLPRMTGIWEMVAGPSLREEDSSNPMSMLALLRRITEAIPPDAPVRFMSVQLGDYRWEFRRLAPLTLLEGPDGAYSVLSDTEASPR